MGERSTARAAVALGAAAAVVAVWSRAALADGGGLHWSGFLGAHVIDGDSALGRDRASSPTIGSSVVFGPRLGWRALPWLEVEGELGVMPTGAGDGAATAIVLIPRVHALFDPRPTAALAPLATAGVSGPAVLSTDRSVVDHDIEVAGHVGAGVRFVISDRWELRVDARWQIGRAVGDPVVAHDFEVLVGVAPWRHRRPPAVAAPIVVDRDGDRIPDERDACPERAEDVDGYEDDDGCPDIDNDFDLVLDIVDACPRQAETPNGFRDDDGCPDDVPPEVAEFVGAVAEIRFQSGSSILVGSSFKTLDRIGDVMTKYPSIRFEIIGHTDDRGDPQANRRLSEERAEAVMLYLMSRGIESWRLRAIGRGPDDPIASNDTDRGRAHNRRVELRLILPKRD